MKKKHIGLKILLGFIVLLLLVTVGLFVRFYPVYKDAKMLAENLNRTSFTYELEAELNREELQEAQAKLLDTLAELTGVKKEAMYRLRVQGSVDGDIIHAVIYPEGQTEPLTELYLSDEEDVVNCAMIYNRMRAYYAADNDLLTYLIPVWNDHEYVSLEQMEQMLDVDLSVVKDLRLPFAGKKLTGKKVFGVLAVMGREKNGILCSYIWKSDGLKVQFSLNNGEVPVIDADISAKKPAKLLAALSEKLSKIGVGLNGEKLRFLDDISVKAELGNGGALQISQDKISQTTVDIIANIRLIIKEIKGNWSVTFPIE